MRIREQLDEMINNIEEAEERLQNIKEILADIRYTDNPNIKDLLESIEEINHEVENALGHLNG